MKELTIENYKNVLGDLDEEVSRTYILSEDLIELLDKEGKIDWFEISIFQKLSESFIEKHSDKMRWEDITMHQKLSEKFLERNKDKLNWCWSNISVYQKLSEEFIDKNINYMSFGNILSNQIVSEEFIERHSDKILDWKSVVMNQTLSESFIEKYSDKLNWSYISIGQSFSVDFFLKHKENIDLFALLQNEKLPDSFWKDIRIKIFFSKQEENIKKKYLKKIKEMK